MTRYFPCALVSGLLATASAHSLAAGGHFDVDDATVLNAGQCQYETWASRSPSTAATLLHLGPACRVGAVELGASLDHVRESQGRSTWVGAQIKWVVDPLFERFSIGAAWSASYDVTHGGRAVQTLYVPATWWAAERLWVHANVGADRSQFGAWTGRRGVSAEWATTDSLTLIAERVTLSNERTLRLGVRWSLTKAVSVDLSAARVGNHGPRVFAVGLNHEFAR